VLDDTVDASTVTRELGGCPVKCCTVFDDQEAGRYWQEADTRLDRQGAHHFGFAGGPHRCLGTQLARREMLIAVEEWRAAIPDHRIATTEPLAERGGQLALLSLPLAWDVTESPEGTTA
jgi:hypothetical protein